MLTYLFNILPVLPGRPDEGDEEEDDRDEQGRVDGHVVLEVGVGKHELKIDRVNLGEVSGPKSCYVGRSAVRDETVTPRINLRNNKPSILVGCSNYWVPPRLHSGISSQSQ